MKAKTTEDPELVKITGTQWEFARKLYNEGFGDKYHVYAVLNAGNSNARIRRIPNPIQLWKDGKLYAHPINFEI